MTKPALADYVLVKSDYPEAFCAVKKTWGGALEYTIQDQATGVYLGPTSFSEETAWKWAAERIRKATAVNQ